MNASWLSLSGQGGGGGGGLNCEGVHLPNFIEVQLLFVSFNLCTFQSQILRQVLTLSMTLTLEDLSERVHCIDKA